MDANFDATLRKWGFRPINDFGQTKSEESAPVSQKPDEEVREIAKKILAVPDVKL